MKDNFIFSGAALPVNIQLFADGGDGGMGTGDTGAVSGATGVISGAADRNNRAKNPLANVVYGKQGGVPDASEHGAPNDANAEFEAFRKSHKEQFDSWAQETIQHRLKGSKDVIDRYNSLAPTIEMLAAKYGVDAEDIAGLNEAIQADDSYYEDEALERGLSVQQLKQIKKLERENSAFRQQAEQQERQQQAEQDIAMWMQQAQEAQQVFPGLDLRTELQNPQFVSLLQNNVDVQTAYFAVHNRELVPQAMQYAARQTEQQVTNKIRANGARPSENGLHSASSAVTKTDVSQLTKADRQEIARRVARGERITF